MRSWCSRAHHCTVHMDVQRCTALPSHYCARLGLAWAGSKRERGSWTPTHSNARAHATLIDPSPLAEERAHPCSNRCSDEPMGVRVPGRSASGDKRRCCLGASVTPPIPHPAPFPPRQPTVQHVTPSQSLGQHAHCTRTQMLTTRLVHTHTHIVSFCGPPHRHVWVETAWPGPRTVQPIACMGQ
jgi:hypothetical protein